MSWLPIAIAFVTFLGSLPRLKEPVQATSILPLLWDAFKDITSIELLLDLSFKTMVYRILSIFVSN